MANSLSQDIKGKMVIVDGRRFHCKGGFGCYSFTTGSALFGNFEDEGRSIRISGHDVERLAPEELHGVTDIKQAVQEAIETNDREDGVNPTCSPGSVS